MKAIILAGGKGTRLWPLSREMYPKQLLTIEDNQSLLQKTYNRLQKFVFPKDIVTITNSKYYHDIKSQLNQLNHENVVIAEPLGKNTAPAIACALQYFKQHNHENDIVFISPSDHLIKNIFEFEKSIENALQLAEQGYIVTFGIKPQYPETGYGYIKTDKAILTGKVVEEFIEKPDYKTARQYIQSGNYYWNSGMFMGKISVFLEEINRFSPEITKLSNQIDFAEDSKITYNIYEKMPSISIDYAVMEKSKRIVLVELLSDWNDLGSWQSIYNIRSKDEYNNVINGNVITHNVKNSFIYSQKELVAVSDLEDIILVETEDAIMACKISEAQNVKILYDKLQTLKSYTAKIQKTVFRPWGYYTCLNQGKGYLTKIICVQPKQRLSLQSHEHRSEHWVVLEGKAKVILQNKEYILNSGESIDVAVKEIHSLQNPYEEELKIIEVQKGDILSEDDIIRYEDYYGRV